MTSASDWLQAFAQMSRCGNGDGISKSFAATGFWRDYLPFGWTLQTLEGRQDIAEFATAHGPKTDFTDVDFEGSTQDKEGFFSFQTHDGCGRGYIRMEAEHCQTLFTMLDDIQEKPYTKTRSDTNPDVLIVGGGQGGLALGAQLDDLGVSYLIVDKHPRVGDQWRSRYDSLVLHDPVWYDHMPFKPFPSDWPVFTPKDQMGDWLETYAQELALKVWNSTELRHAQYDQDTDHWRVELNRHGEPVELRPRHVVLALGLSGFARVPEFEGQNEFKGQQLHSSEYRNGHEYSGQDVVIVGANNSAHDIAADLVSHGARPLMLQRSSTLVVRQQDYCEKVLGPLYSAEALARGITTEKADLLQASMPLRLLEQRHRTIWDGIRQQQADFYQQLSDVGFCLDFAEDDTGLGMKYRRTASGYYIDVGGSAMVVNGRIGIRSGCTINHLSENTVHLSTDEAVPADAIIYATGYGNLCDWVSALIDTETADRVGPCWGYGSNTRGDPGPWIGELRNMWMPTAQSGLWFTGGNLSQARYFSRLLALQLVRQLS